MLIGIYTHTYTYKHTYIIYTSNIIIYIYMYIYIYRGVYIYIDIQIHTCVYTLLCMHIYAGVYTHTYNIHICMYVGICQCIQPPQLCDATAARLQLRRSPGLRGDSRWRSALLGLYRVGEWKMKSEVGFARVHGDNLM